MFKAEEAVIASERVRLPAVEYCDNYRCLQMLEDPPSGIFHLLDTCCRVHATPSSFCVQVHQVHLPECEFLVPSINGANEDRAFTVRHFAGDVEYRVDDFMAKNTETFEAQTRQLLEGAPGLSFLRPVLEQQGVLGALNPAQSEAMPIAAAARGRAGRGEGGNRWANAAASAAAMSRGPTDGGGGGAAGGGVGKVASSTGRRFLRDMSRLMAQLQATTAHFVHCVKPNGMEQPELLSYEMVAEQLTSLGTLETVQLMGLGFPVRLKYEEVRRRFLPRLINIAGSTLLSPKLFTEMIMEVCDMTPGDYKLGVTRIFLRHRAAQVLEALEPLETSVMEQLVSAKVSAFWEAASRIRDRLLTYHHHRKFREFWRGVLIAQKYLRMWLCHSRYRRTLAMASRIQHAQRSRKLHQAYRGRRERRLAALALQAAFRMHADRAAFTARRDAALALQRYYRRLHPLETDDPFEDDGIWGAVSSWIGRLGWAQEKEATAQSSSANLLLQQLGAHNQHSGTRAAHQYEVAKRLASKKRTESTATGVEQGAPPGDGVNEAPGNTTEGLAAPPAPKPAPSIFNLFGLVSAFMDPAPQSRELPSPTPPAAAHVPSGKGEPGTMASVDVSAVGGGAEGPTVDGLPAAPPPRRASPLRRPTAAMRSRWTPCIRGRAATSMAPPVRAPASIALPRCSQRASSRA